jgi:hypothetical protein
MELFVDIPLFDQENAPLEILVALDEADVDKNVKHRLDAFNNLDDDLKNVLKKNASINIDGQLKIIKLIEDDIKRYRFLLNWSAYPTYDQILAVIELAWNNLLKPGENKADIRSPAHLAVLTIKYSNLKSVSALINDIINDSYYVSLYPEEQKRINTMAFFILNITRHWFDYKLPKWISVISDLQEYVLKKNNMPFGNYSFFASSLEHTFLPASLAALMEYDIPVSAINKLRRFLNENLSPETLINQCNRMTDEALKSRGLINYEIKKIRNAF